MAGMDQMEFETKVKGGQDTAMEAYMGDAFSPSPLWLGVCGPPRTESNTTSMPAVLRSASTRSEEPGPGREQRWCMPCGG